MLTMNEKDKNEKMLRCSAGLFPDSDNRADHINAL